MILQKNLCRASVKDRGHHGRDKMKRTPIPVLNTANEPSDVIRCLHLCGYDRAEDALEGHIQWVRNKTSPFRFRSVFP
jgi:hypothetical protein